MDDYFAFLACVFGLRTCQATAKTGQKGRLDGRIRETGLIGIDEMTSYHLKARVLTPSVPSKPPSLQAMLQFVGELGGWVSTPGRKDMPGPQTTWMVYNVSVTWLGHGKCSAPKQKNTKKMCSTTRRYYTPKWPVIEAGRKFQQYGT